MREPSSFTHRFDLNYSLIDVEGRDHACAEETIGVLFAEIAKPIVVGAGQRRRELRFHVRFGQY